MYKFWLTVVDQKQFMGSLFLNRRLCCCFLWVFAACAGLVWKDWSLPNVNLTFWQASGNTGGRVNEEPAGRKLWPWSCCVLLDINHREGIYRLRTSAYEENVAARTIEATNDVGNLIGANCSRITVPSRGIKSM
ncbi:uncharacterized protein PpBr36_06805 [Pyricularia pennisetigena]|uniref:uncharacterized protein n=1 Tax=Pyricularia pennisetigena TaxID=1578925 RepID=UPI00114FDCDF|nr:uncharacterized protein PpBr36_06805 [Pyricularia pennisetigena]TLS23568.1 hypothetical protein PpBr36_06805 [Pyricularia pennisetigena]